MRAVCMWGSEIVCVGVCDCVCIMCVWCLDVSVECVVFV